MPLTNSLDAIRALLDGDCVCADGANCSDAHLEEKQSESKLRKVILSGLVPGMLLLATDLGQKPRKKSCISPYFSQNGVYKHNCVCDYVLLKQTNKIIEVYYIELKSNNPNRYMWQFKSTQCFMRYIFDLVRNICEVNCNIGREKFIVLHTCSGKKQSTQYKPPPLHEDNKPNNPHKILAEDGKKILCKEIFQ